MEKYWICSNCGSANLYPDITECEVCGKEINEIEIKRAEGTKKHEKSDFIDEKKVKSSTEKSKNGKILSVVLLVIILLSGLLFILHLLRDNSSTNNAPVNDISLFEFYISVDDVDLVLPMKASEFKALGFEVWFDFESLEINPYDSYLVDGCMFGTATKDGESFDIGCVYIPDGENISYNNVYINKIKIESNNRMVSEKRVKIMRTLELGHFTYDELKTTIGYPTYGNFYEEVYEYDKTGKKSDDPNSNAITATLSFTFLNTNDMDRGIELITGIDYWVSDISKYNRNVENSTLTYLTQPIKKYDTVDLKQIILEDNSGNIITFDADDTLSEIAEKYEVDDELLVFTESGDGSIGWSYRFDDQDGILTSRFDNISKGGFIAIGRIYIENSYLVFRIECDSLQNDGKMLSDYNISIEISEFLYDIYDFDNFCFNGVSLSDSKEYVESLWGIPEEKYDNERVWCYSIQTNSNKLIFYYVYFDDNNRVVEIYCDTNR